MTGELFSLAFPPNWSKGTKQNNNHGMTSRRPPHEPAGQSNTTNRAGPRTAVGRRAAAEAHPHAVRVRGVALVLSGARARDDPGPRDAHSALSSADALLGGGVRHLLQILARGDDVPQEILRYRRIDVPAIG